MCCLPSTCPAATAPLPPASLSPLHLPCAAFAAALPVASLCGLSDALAVEEEVCKTEKQKDATASCHLKNYPFLNTIVHLLESFQMETIGIHKEYKLCLTSKHSYSLMLNACSFLKGLEVEREGLICLPSCILN